MTGSRLEGLRRAASLTQGELAARAGVSRQMVGALEAGRHLPRVDAAISLAVALGVDVSDLFGTGSVVVDVVSGEPPEVDQSVRLGWVGDRLVSAPARVTADGWNVADGVVEENGQVLWLTDVRSGVVVAGCEPGLETVEHLLRQGGRGGLAVATSSAGAVAALQDGRVHAAVVHGPSGRLPPIPADVARYRLTSWRVGLSVPSDLGPLWWSQVLAGELEVVQREKGASAQQTFEEAVGGAGLVPGRVVGGHVAAARHGSVVGLPAVTIEPAALAMDSGFHALQRHEAELWVGERWLDDRGVEELLGLIVSSRFQRRLRAVGGYDLEGVGRRVA